MVCVWVVWVFCWLFTGLIALFCGLLVLSVWWFAGFCGGGLCGLDVASVGWLLCFNDLSLMWVV